VRPLPRSARKKPRVLFYSHDGLGLGHFRRTLAVAESLARRVPGASRLILTGQPFAGAFDLPETLDYVRMPGLDKKFLYEANPEKEPGAPQNVITVRKSVIAATFDAFAPHVFVIDHTPAGLAGELLPVLNQPGRKSARPMVVLGLRDIIYGPERTRQLWEADGTYELLENVYDLILVYGSPMIFDPIEEYRFSPSVAAKTRFTGYFRRPEPLRPIEEVRRELKAHGAALIKTFLKAVRRGDLAMHVASVVTGPQMPASDGARLAALAEQLPHVTLVPFRSDLESHIAAADVVVTMGGYNSVWEAIGSGKRPIIAPRHGGDDEQPLRAARLAALGLATVVPPDELTPATLAAAINAALERRDSPHVNVEFEGLQKTGKALAKILRRRLDGAEPIAAKNQSAATPPNAASAPKKHKSPSKPPKPGAAIGAKLSNVRATPSLPEADVIVCVHDAVDDVRLCLSSLSKHTDPRHRLILVDDASGQECREELGRFTASHGTVNLLRNDERLGYTKSANRGLRYSSADLVVLLNSDTVVTPEWLERLLECAESDSHIGIVGPLSNSATFQSVPERYTSDEGWAHNALPEGWSPDDLAAAIAAIAPRAFPRLGFLNGFCFGIKRAVIDAIGYFDEDAFPDGYGEEQDYCFRAAKSGFELAVADHSYVYHTGTRSYRSEQRQQLKESARAALLRKHKEKRIRAAITRTSEEPTLAFMRNRVAVLLRETSPPHAFSGAGDFALAQG
jgi:predicted glycosyltransferase/GT2 family glycosyltransferase